MATEEGGMPIIYRTLVFPAIRALTLNDAERAHDMAIRALNIVGQTSVLRHTFSAITQTRGLGKNMWGLYFPNPLAIASGFDKHGLAARGLETLGFGFVMGGTVTPRPQAGRPKPRVFRLTVDRSIINRYGFNSIGAEDFVENLKLFGRSRVPYGISLGVNATTPSDKAVDDLITVLVTVFDYGDFFVVNVSSPNTTGLRDLQDPRLLEPLLKAIQAKLRELMERRGEWRKKALLVKLAPDLTENQLGDTLEACDAAEVDGVIFSNTSIERPLELASRHWKEVGGLSGPTQFDRTCAGVSFIRRLLPNMPIMGVGGVEHAWQAGRLLDLGADFIKIYTGFVYGGPMLPSRIARGMWRRGFASNDAVEEEMVLRPKIPA
jgi:dihydroorotate dehydrogenase